MSTTFRITFLLLFFTTIIGTVCFYNSTYFFNFTPSILYPAEILYETKELGDVITQKFFIQNQGFNELVINDIRSNCSCTGLETREGSEFFRASEIRIKGRQKSEVQLRVSVRGAPPESRLINKIYFKTNDPVHSECQIDVIVNRVTAGVYSVPETLVINSTVSDKKIINTIDIMDDAINPRSIEGVSISDNKNTSVSFLKNSGQLMTKTNKGPTTIGQIVVTNDASIPGPINATIKILISGRENNGNYVRIIGNIDSNFEISPKAIILPRHSPNGPVYKARCICRNNENSLIEASVKKLPKGITAHFPNSSKGKFIPIEFIMDPMAYKQGAETNYPIEIDIKSESKRDSVFVQIITESAINE
jgi:hypothetical protein